MKTMGSYIAIVIALALDSNAFAQALDRDEAQELAAKAINGDSAAQKRLERETFKSNPAAEEAYINYLIKTNQQDEAAKQLSLFARHGNRRLIYTLARAYHSGYGKFIEKSDPKSLALLNFSIELGLTSAQAERDKFAATLNPDEVSLAERILKNAKEQNSFTGVVERIQASTIKPSHAADQNRSSTWTDPSTGLMWTTCIYGQTITTDSDFCQVDATIKVPETISPMEAVMFVKGLKFEGFSNWRIPSKSEIKSISEYIETARLSYIKNTPGENLRKLHQPYPSALIDTSITPVLPKGKIWVAANVDSDMIRDHLQETAILQDAPLSGTGERFIADRIKNPGYFLVRGGQVSQAWDMVVQLAVQINQQNTEFDSKIKSEEKTRRIRDAEQLDQAAKSQAEREAKKSEDFRKAREANEKKNTEYAEATRSLQASVKPGDEVSQGLVLEVKGNLVKIQHFRRDCTFRSSSGMCYSYSKDRIPTDQGWLNRYEILPVKSQ